MYLDQRYMDQVEANLYRSGSFPRFATEFTGKFNLNSAITAFDCLLSKHAILRAKAKEDSHGILLYLDDNYSPKLDVNGHSLSESSQVRELLFIESANMAARKKPGELVKACIIHGEILGYVSFGIDHSIMDFSSTFQYFADFWQLYTDIENGKEIVRDFNRRLPKAPSTILRERWGTNETDTETTKLDPGKKDAITPTPVHNTTRRKEYFIDFNNNSYEKIASLCTKEKVGLNSFLAGVMAQIIRTNSFSNDSTSMNFLVAIDQRKGVHPPIGPAETTILVRAEEITFEVSPSDGPIEIARNLSMGIKKSREHRGDPYLSRPILRNPYDISVQLNGVSRNATLPSPASLEVTDYFEPALDPLFQERDERAITRRNVPFFAKSSIAPYIFNGRLRILLGLRDDLDCEAIYNQFIDVLKACS